LKHLAYELPTGNAPGGSSHVKTVAFFERATTESVSPAGEIEAATEWRGAECVVTLSGRITIGTSPDLRLLLLKRLQLPDCRILTADLQGVTYIDTSGLAILVELLKAAYAQGKTLRLNHLQERPRYLLESTRLLHLFAETGHEDSACDACSEGQ